MAKLEVYIWQERGGDMLYSLSSLHGDYDKNGCLCVMESQSHEVPFEIKRIYYIYNVAKGVTRGFHAHKTLRQILICVSGKIKVTLDNGIGAHESYLLDNPTTGLYVGPNMWRTMEWIEADSVLLVLASEHYDESDYIRDYRQFIDWVGQERC